MVSTSADPELVKEYVEKLNDECYEKTSTAFIPWEKPHLVSGDPLVSYKCGNTGKLCYSCCVNATKFIKGKIPRRKNGMVVRITELENKLTEHETLIHNLQDQLNMVVGYLNAHGCEKLNN